MAKPKLIAAFGLAVLAIIWILQNTGPVQTKFLFVIVTMPQAALLAIMILVGAGAGILLSLTLGGSWSRRTSSPNHAMQSTPIRHGVLIRTDLEQSFI